MGLFKGTMTVHRFKVVENLPSGFERDFIDRLTRKAFAPPPTEPGTDVVQGWVQFNDILGTDFSSYKNWYYPPWVFLILRSDQKKLPTKMIQAETKRAIKAWEEDNGTKCSADRKKLLAEEIKDRHLATTRPKSQFIELAWHLDSGMVFVDKLGLAQLDRVKLYFFQTFALSLKQWSPADMLSEGQTAELLNTHYVRFGNAT